MNVHEIGAEQFVRVLETGKAEGRVVGVKGAWGWKKIHVFDNENAMKAAGFRKAAPSEILTVAKGITKRENFVESNMKIREAVYTWTDSLGDDVKRKVSDQWGGFSKRSAKGISPLDKAQEFVDNSEGALIQAIADNDLEKFKTLIVAGANPKAKDKTGQTLLHLTAANGKLEFVKFLIKKGVNINAKDNDGNTPLHDAVKNHRGEIAQLLISKKADVNIENREGHKPLFTLFDGGKAIHFDEHQLRTLIQAFKAKGVQIHDKDKDGNSLLHLAAKHGCEYGTLQHLALRENMAADIDAANNEGNRPLHLAAERGDAELCDRLITFLRAEPKVQNDQRDTPLHLAAANEQPIHNALLKRTPGLLHVKNDQGDTPLHNAARLNNAGNLKALIERAPREFFIDQSNEAGETALHLAMQKNNIESVLELLKAGAKGNVKNKASRTPLHILLKEDNKHMFLGLSVQDYKSDFANDHRDEDGNTPLYFAIMNKNFEWANYLLDHAKPKFNEKNKNEQSPLDLAKVLLNIKYKDSKLNEGMKALVEKMEPPSSKPSPKTKAAQSPSQKPVKPKKSEGWNPFKKKNK